VLIKKDFSLFSSIYPCHHVILSSIFILLHIIRNQSPVGGHIPEKSPLHGVLCAYCVVRIAYGVLWIAFLPCFMLFNFIIGHCLFNIGYSQRL